MFLYLHGFASGPTSSKAQYFRQRLPGLIVPTLDEGDFEHLTISRQLRLVEGVTTNEARPHVLIGSSLGGYLAALHASRHPVDALILMAPAVDFAQRIETRSAAEFRQWEQRGFTLVDHFATGRKERLSFEIMRDARLHDPFPRISAPTLVLQGRHDEVVPLASVERWAAQQPDARLVVYETGHELTDVVDAMFIEATAFLKRLALMSENGQTTAAGDATSGA